MNKLIKLNKLKKLNNKGLTLTEVMVSVLIFAILIVPIVTQLSSLLKQNYTVKVNQAETDYATRVMEQFKELDADAVEIPLDNNGNEIVESDGTIKTKAGYTVDKSNAKMYVYSMNGVQLEKDLDVNATSVSKNGVTYDVKVSLDSAAYDTSSGDTPVYKNPNDTIDYKLANIDDSNSVMIKEIISNYDSRAEIELLDKYLEQLKQKDINKYNRYMNGADVLQNLAYAKNIYVKVAKGTKSGQACYLVTVKLIYTENNYGEQVEYPIMSNKVYYASKTGNVPPSVYIFYNQYIQENMIVDGSDSITIDNSECQDEPIKCYVIKGETESSGTYEYYVRKTEKGSQTVESTATLNTAGSYVYKVVTDNGVRYKWPSYVTDTRDDAKYGSEPVATVPVPTSGSTGVTEPYEQNSASPAEWYVYNDVITTVAPSSDYYDRYTGEGSYSYIRKEDDTADNPTGVNGTLLKQGDCVYQRSDNQYVWPDGTVSNHSPDIAYFYLCTPSKKEYATNVKLNLMLAQNSVFTNNGQQMISVYTNLNPSSDFRSSLYLMGATGATSTGVGIKYNNYQAISDLTSCVKGLESDKGDGANRLYHIKLELYKNEGTESKKILTLESGKEG